MKKVKSIWLTITGSIGSIAPALFACCKSTACVGICASPLASVFGISTASIANAPIVIALEPLLIALSAVSFTVSYYTIYVLPKFAVCTTEKDCGCTRSKKEQRKMNMSKLIFWLGLIASISFLSYFEYQKFQSNQIEACSSEGCDEILAPSCCPDSSDVDQHQTK